MHFDYCCFCLGGFIPPIFFIWGKYLNLDRSFSNLEQKLYDLSRKITEGCGLKLYDAEYISGSSTLRVYIMNPETKTAVIEDCVEVDRGFTPYCEEEEWIPEDFILEVSSPGMYRHIKTAEHLELAKNERVLLVLDKFLEEMTDVNLPKKVAKNKKVEGVLKNFTSENIEIELLDTTVEISLENIKKMNLNPEIN